MADKLPRTKLQHKRLFQFKESITRMLDCVMLQYFTFETNLGGLQARGSEHCQP